MHRPRKPTQAEIGTNWSARQTATDVKVKAQGELPHHHYHKLWVAPRTYVLLIPTIFDRSRSIAHVRQVDATSPFQMANSGARFVQWDIQQQATISAAQHH